MFGGINVNYVFFCLEILGIIAFSISGALVAIRRRFDIFGVVVVGLTTAIGGGIIRDVISGHTPPMIFSNVYLLGVSVATSVLTFLLAYVKRSKFLEIQSKIENVNNYFDAIGLSVFTIMGVETVFTYGYADNVLLSISMGVLTGVGGGLMRDIFTNSPPYIFTKHVYALTSILGACIFYALRIYLQNTALSTIVGISVVFILRVLATIYHWRLPIAHVDEDCANKDK